MFNLCKYKDILGIAGDKKKPRFLGIRIQDVIFLLVFNLIFWYLTKNNFIKTLIFLLIIMVIVHRIFCVRSATDKIIFPDENEKNNKIRFILFIIVGLYIIYYYKLIPKL
jgi:hypothetical protein